MVEQGDLTGKRLASYKILSKLGQGGMAVVYKAHEMSLNRVVALKVIAPHLVQDRSFVDRFKREAQAAAQLNHPNIVQIYAIGQEDDVHFFAMEYVQGRTLLEIVKEEGCLPAARATSIVRQVAEALAVAHDAGIVHRDIKPSNIMLDATDLVKVADFGIAQITSAATRLTREGCFIGTPEYVSPEQCKGEPVDGRSDIYSLGVTYYEMLSGKPPFEADSPAGLAFRIVEGNCPTVCELAPTVPTAVERIVGKMMAPDIEQRYQSAAELVAALPAAGEPFTTSTDPVAAARAAPAAAARPGPAEKKEKKEKKRRATPLVYVALGALAVIVAIASWQSLRPARGEPGSGDPAGMAAPGKPAPDRAEGAAVEPVDVPREAPAVKEREPAAVVEETASAADAVPEPPAVPPEPPADPAREPVAMPAPDTLIATATGDYEYVDLVNSSVEGVFAEQGFVVVDWPSAPARSMYEVAGLHCVTTAKLVGVSPLRYHGRVTDQFTVMLTVKVVSLDDGTIAAGPLTETVQYTAFNVEEELKGAARAMASELASRLRDRMEGSS
jgi:predicted Ser/Thr protein kinase